MRKYCCIIGVIFSAALALTAAGLISFGAIDIGYSCGVRTGTAFYRLRAGKAWPGAVDGQMVAVCLSQDVTGAAEARDAGGSGNAMGSQRYFRSAQFQRRQATGHLERRLRKASRGAPLLPSLWIRRRPFQAPDDVALLVAAILS